jgi:transmembrane sensor
MPSSNEANDAMTREATAWYVRLKDAAATEADRFAFERWVSADPARSRAYDEAARLWSRLQPAAAELGAGGWYRSPRRPLRRLVPVAAVVVGLVTGALWWRDPGLIDRVRADHATAPGQRREVVLGDGSRAHLDGDTALSVTLDAARRDVRLLRGRAWFEVRSNQPGSFRVIAGSVEARVRGTTFAVERQADAVVVTVEGGRVEVTTPGLASSIELTAGKAAELRPGAVPALRTIDPDLASAWRRGLIVLDRAPLSRVVEELNRLAIGRIVMTDDALGRLPLSGVFRADDPEHILGALRSALGVKTTRIPGFATLIHR